MADTTEAVAPDTSTDSASIADHEAAFMGGEEPSPKPVEKPVAKADAESRSEEPPTSRERDERGKFKPRPAAAAPAKAETPPAETVESLTERLRTLEAENTSLKAAKPAVTTPPATAREPEPRTEPAARAEKFPKFEQWAAIKGNEAKDFDDFLDERENYNYDRRREQERLDERAQAAVMEQNKLLSAYSEQLPAVLKKYPDYETVVVKADPERIKTSKVIERAVLEIGPEMAYYLVTHDAERKALSEESLVDPENPAFPAAVAAMKRYLKTLIAAEPPAPEPKPVATRPTLVPRPPSMTKTGGMPPSDDAPEDDASIASHEAYFGPKSGRR